MSMRWLPERRLQRVTLPPELRTFSVVCTRCLEWASPKHGYFGSVVEGELPARADSLRLACPKGHEIEIVARSAERHAEAA
jgi:hypothetical protein